MDLFVFGKIVATSLAAKTKAVLGNLTGDGSSFDPQHPEDDQGSEFVIKGPLFGALGLIFRPRPPSSLRNGAPVHAEYMGRQDGGSTTAVAYRDLRLNEQYQDPPEGVVALVGYGGGKLKLEDAGASGDQKATKVTLEVPYSFSGGVPAKFHRIVVDPDAATITITHGDGLSIKLSTSAIELGHPGGGTIPVALATPLLDWLNGAGAGKLGKFITEVTTYINGAAPGSVTPVTPAPASIAATDTKAT